MTTEDICKSTPLRDKAQIRSLRSECNRLREENEKLKVHQPPRDAEGFRATYTKEFNFAGDNNIWCVITVKPVNDTTYHPSRHYHYFARICVPCDPCKDVDHYRDICIENGINCDVVRQDGELINIYRDWQHDMDYNDIPISYIEAWINNNAAGVANLRCNGVWS